MACSMYIEGVVSRRAGEQKLWQHQQRAKEYKQSAAICSHCPDSLIELQCRCMMVNGSRDNS
jgi:hypothetical protein